MTSQTVYTGTAFKNSCLSAFSLPVIILNVSVTSPLRRLVSRRSLAGELSLSCAQPASDE